MTLALLLPAVLLSATLPPAGRPTAPDGPCDSALAAESQWAVGAALQGFLGHFTRLDSTAPHRVTATTNPALCRRAIRALIERNRQTGFTAAAADSVAVVAIDDSVFYIVLRRDQQAGEWQRTSWFDHDWQWIAGLLL